MARPIALCIEDLDASDTATRFVRCTALVGRQPGLRLGPDGEAHWQTGLPVGCELWVSADDRLIAYRPAESDPVVLDRAGRRLELPIGKPVVALDQDVLLMGARRLRIHLHGFAAAIAAPAPLPDRARSRAAQLVAVMAVGAAVTGCERPEVAAPPVEVRDQPPEVAAPPRDPDPASTGSQRTWGPFAPPPPSTTTPADPLATPPPPAPPSAPPIEVRDEPPEAPAE